MSLELKNIVKKYNNEKEKILDDVNITFSKGEFVSILGESGSGKSTLMNIIGGLDLNYSGNVMYNNRKLEKSNVDDYRKNKIGFIFQSFNLFSHLTAFENVKLVQEINSNSDSDKIIDLFKKLNIEDIMDKKPNQLSGGQKQRVAIARALINDPEIILADEPTGALDNKNTSNIINILKDISKEGKIVIIVTHSEEVAKNSSRIIKINDGKVLIDKTNYVTDITYNENKLTKKRKISIFSLLKIAFRNLKKNIKRNLLIILGTSIGIFSISFMLFLNSGIKKYINDQLVNSENANVIEVKKSNDILKEEKFENEDIEKISNINHVNKLYKNTSISGLSSINYLDKKYELMSLSTYTNINKKELKYGNICKDNEIVISEYLAKSMINNIKSLIGKEVTLYLLENSKPLIMEKKVIISGIIKNTNNEFIDNMNFAYIPYNSLEKMYSDNNIKLNPTNLSIKIDNIKNSDSVKKRLDFYNYSHSNMSKMIDSITKYIDIITFILIGISGVSLVVSSIMIFIIMYINVIERTKEIGILKSLGCKETNIKLIFVLESFLIGLFSGIYGCLASSIITKIINSYTLSKYKSLFIDINLKYVFITILISIFISVVSGLKPSIKASKLDPVESLRYE